MKKLSLFLATLALVALPLAHGAVANDKAKVQKFYDFLSNPGSKSHAKAFRANLHGKWQSVGNDSGRNKTADAFIGQLGFFAKLIPDLKW